MLARAAIALAAVYIVGHWLAGAAILVLFLIWHLLPGEDGPPVLALALTTQWTQVTVGIFYSGLTGRALPAIDGSDYEPMVLMGLGCVTALAIGVWLGIRVMRNRVGRPAVMVEELVAWRPLLIAYGAALVSTGVVQQLAWMFPGLTQAILAVGFVHLAIVFLILRRLTRPQLRGGPILGLLAIEVALGFTGYFSGFKEPLFLAVLATLEVFDRRRVEHWAAAGALGATLVLASVMWMGVRSEFREEFFDSAFASSRSLRLQRMQALLTDWLERRDATAQHDLDMLIDRWWAIYYPALAVARVPAVLPHTDGELIRAALHHLATPRLLFPDKGELPSDSEMVRKYSGVWVAGADENTSIAFGYAVESYVDFGVPVMFVPVLVFGIFCGLVYEWLLRALAHRELAVALVTVVFWLSLYLFERSWVRTVGLSVTMMVYLGGLGFLLDRFQVMRALERQSRNAGSIDAAYEGVGR